MQIMRSHVDIPLHKYMSIIQRYWYVSFKRVITNLVTHEMRLERRLIAETVGLNW